MKQKERITPAASRLNNATSWQRPNPSESPNDVDSSLTTKQYMRVGLCGVCLMPIETDQNNPTIANTRHVETKVPYGKCRT